MGRSNINARILKTTLFALCAITIFTIVAGLVYVYAYIDTEYAPSYSESGFNSIHVGMLEHEVTQLIGTPFSRATYDRGNGESEDYLYYARQGSDKKANYYARIIVLDNNGTVARKIAELFVE